MELERHLFGSLQVVLGQVTQMQGVTRVVSSIIVHLPSFLHSSWNSDILLVINQYRSIHSKIKSKPSHHLYSDLILSSVATKSQNLCPPLHLFIRLFKSFLLRIQSTYKVFLVFYRFRLTSTASIFKGQYNNNQCCKAKANITTSSK